MPDSGSIYFMQSHFATPLFISQHFCLSLVNVIQPPWHTKFIISIHTINICIISIIESHYFHRQALKRLHNIIIFIYSLYHIHKVVCLCIPWNLVEVDLRSLPTSDRKTVPRDWYKDTMSRDHDPLSRDQTRPMREPWDPWQPFPSLISLDPDLQI